ncbi:lipopolysaccharide biosynthesis protein [Streptococcus marmotae]|uniref:lipopolysaccharide biosynthesis protein n=1 Tax=Streptococcus marmotae TaxID=1825069 RepID=UPI00082DD74E|nr:hypothetical protein [Streptococcus marmotae]
MKTRTQQALHNSFSTISIFFLRLIFEFINRLLFLRFLGVYYLGLNGIFTSILGTLSLAELGIGTSITFALYKPIAESKTRKIVAYMRLYRAIYRVIAFIILLLGLAVLPFLPTILQESSLTTEVISIYLLFLMNSVMGYLLFSYKQSLLVAYRENYVISWMNFGIIIVSSLIQWIVLFTTQSYLLVRTLILLTTLVSNLLISYLVDKRHPLNDEEIEPLTPSEKSSLKKNVFGNLAGSIAGAVVFSTDNILMSTFISVATVGLYSNYTIITGSLNSFLSQLMGSQRSTVGNLVHTSDGEKVYQMFKRYNFLNFAIAFLFSLSIVILIQPFIMLWLGKEYLLSSRIVALLSVYTFVQMYRYAGFVFYNAYGLYWESRHKPIAEAVLNLTLSLLFLAVFKWGIEGILLGTICSTLLTNTWFEPYIIFKYGLKRPITEFVWTNVKQWGLFFGVLGLIHWLNTLLVLPYGLLPWLCAATLTVLALSSIIFLVYNKNEEFKWWWQLLTSRFAKLIRK